MSKFKVGDRVKTCFGIGKIVEIEKDCVPYLVYHDDWNGGHNGNGASKKEYSGNHCHWFCASDLELIKSQITSEIKITNRITNQLEDLRIWLETSGKVLSNPENYKQWFMGMWEKDNPIIEKKEGNDMLESLNLVDLYASKQKEKIESETKKKVEELKEKNEIINKFSELIDKFKKDCDELYLSQFTEEEKNDILIDKDFDDSDMPLTREDGYLGNYVINLDFKPSEYYDLMNARNIEINKINELVKTVKAHVGIAKTKEEVEEILTRYEILDKKGKLKI